MNEDRKKGGFPLSGVLILLAALGLLQFAERPYRGSRPKVPEVHEASEKINSRLWQDPFRAVLDQSAKAKVADTPVEEAGLCDLGKNASYCLAFDNTLRTQIETNSCGKGKVTVLGVAVFGGPYAEETENRMRDRYAVLSALGNLGYVPDDPEHIGFLRIARDNGGALAMSHIMPYEWLSLAADGENKVLIIWINDKILGDEPLVKLERLAKCLQLKEFDGKPEFGNGITFKFIGPAGSTRLKAMVEELRDFRGDLAGLEIYSASATIDDSLLLDAATRKEVENSAGNLDPGKWVKKSFDKHRIEFRRTIASDLDLMKILLAELKLRNLKYGDKGPDSGEDHIMLVAEWDTLYARSFLNSYEEIFRTNGIPKTRLVYFNYMRGIDGSLPGEKEEEAPQKTDTSDFGSLNVKLLEKPIGKSQYDYLRRMADEAYRFEKLELRPRGGSITAIGILGSDFYDKFLALQALRQKFPAALFFTTDLDARLLHPENTRWTRNLIVASSFGLTVPEIQPEGSENPKKIPLCFRINYQSSRYFATLLALDPDNALIERNLQKEKQPRTFEIGRHSAVELMPKTASTVWGMADGLGTELKNSRNRLLLNLGKMAAITALLLVLLYFSSQKIKNTLKTLATGRRNMLAALVLIGGIFLLWFLFLVDMPGQEPFSLNEGLSIWPTEILRLLSILLSFCFLVFATASLRKNNKEITRNFFGWEMSEKARNEESSPEKVPEKPGFLPWVKRKVKTFCDSVDYNWNVENGGQTFTMDELWETYLSRNSLRYQVVRLAPIIIFYSSLCIMIMAFSEHPVVPVRGKGSSIFDVVVLFLSVLSFILLNFYVFDITRTCRRFIDLAGDKYKWSQSSCMELGPKDIFPEGEELVEWKAISLIANRTRVVGKFIFYPIIVWFIQFLARLNYFDTWHMPRGLGLVLTLGAAYAWSSAFVLRRSAENAREKALKRLTNRLAETLADEKQDQQTIRQVEFALQEIKSNRKGAFAPFTQNPVLQSLIIPFGGVGGWYLFDFLSQLASR